MSEPTAARPLRVAIVGAGWVTTHRHVPSLRAQAHAKVAGIIDRYDTRAADAAKKLRIEKFSNASRLADVPWLDEIDAVTVGTSPFTHHALVMEALRLGKHVLSEKPFAMSVAEGEEMVAAAKQANRILAIVHNFQFARASQQLLADIARGAIGKITSIEAVQLSNPNRRLPVWYGQLPGGLFYDESPHLLYLLRLLGGGDAKLRAAFAQRDKSSSTPATLTAHFESANGVPMRLGLNFVAPVSEWHVAVCGEKSLGVIDVFRDIYIRLPNDGLHVTGTVFRTSWSATIQHWLGHFVPGFQHFTGGGMYGNREVMRRFISACRENKPPKNISAEDALAVLRLQHEVLAACGICGDESSVAAA